MIRGTILKSVALGLMAMAFLSELKEFIDVQRQIRRPLQQGTGEKHVASSTTTELLRSFEQDSFCVPWAMNTDVWWIHHPEWFNVKDNATHTCFERRNNTAAQLFREVYENQWSHGCDDVLTRIMWGSGWGADLMNVVQSVGLALKLSKPLTLLNIDPVVGWHYAAVKEDGSRPTCPERSISCYFLPLSPCRPQRSHIHRDRIMPTKVLRQQFDDLHEYVTRQQHWLRKAVWDFQQTIAIKQPCAVIHVRRADVVLHETSSRKYYPVSAYVQRLPDYRKQNIFLLTDDANAVDEAHEFFPDTSWYYINRTRFRGSEGGWENQTPSRDPKKEVITILGTFQLVQQCDVFVHGKSGFSDDIYRAMSKHQEVVRLRVEGFQTESQQVHNAKNAASEKDLQELLQQQRANNKNTTTKSKTKIAPASKTNLGKKSKPPKKQENSTKVKVPSTRKSKTSQNPNTKTSKTEQKKKKPSQQKKGKPKATAKKD